MADYKDIAGRIRTTAFDGVVVEAQEILDINKNKKQSEVNAETDATLAEHTSTINGLNSQNYVTVTATDQTTAVTDVLPATGEVATVYRVGNWDGSQYDETCYSEYSWNGSAYVHISTKTQIGEVFDISAYHASGGTLATYADLSAALGTNGANIPESLRKGGMSVKFVLTDDNKYVQYRLMSDTFNTTVANWQGVDEEPISESPNLVKSGGVKNEENRIETEIGFPLSFNSGEKGTFFFKYPFEVGKKYRAYNLATSNASCFLKQTEGGSNVQTVASPFAAGTFVDFTVLQESNYIGGYNGSQPYAIKIECLDAAIPVLEEYVDTKHGILKNKEDAILEGRYTGGATVPSSDGNGYDFIYEVKVGDKVQAQCTFGAGVYMAIYPSIQSALNGTSVLQVITQSITTEPVEGVCNYDGFLRFFIRKVDSGTLSDADVTALKENISIEIWNYGEVVKQMLAKEVIDEPISGSTKPISSGGVKYAFEEEDEKVGFRKAFDSGAKGNFFFKYPFEVGQKYRITNLSDGQCSCFLKETESGANVQTVSSSFLGEVFVDVVVEHECNYIGGYNGSKPYKISVEPISAAVTGLQRYVVKQHGSVTTQDDALIARRYVKDTTVESTSGNRYSYIFEVKKGTKIKAKSSFGAGLYISLHSNVTGVFLGNSVLQVITDAGFTTDEVESEALSDGFLRFTIKKDSDEVITNEDITSIRSSTSITLVNYGEVLEAFLANDSNDNTPLELAVNGSYEFSYPLLKDHSYWIENKGNINISMFTRNVSNTNVAKIVSEMITEFTLPTYLQANSWRLYEPDQDTKLIGGYAAQQVTISITDVTEWRKMPACSLVPNLIFESREGRVSSVVYPPNTKYAISEAARNQYDRIRFTVQKTSDGYYVLVHDDSINNIARNSDGTTISTTVKVKETTLENLNQYDYGILWGSKYAGMTIPMLEDALYYSHLFNLGVTLEFRGGNFVNSDFDAIFALLCKYGVAEHVNLVCEAAADYLHFLELSEKFSCCLGVASVESLEQNIESYRQKKTPYNDLYCAAAPWPTMASDELIAAIYSYGFKPWDSNILGRTMFYARMDKGFALLQIAHVPYVKTLAFMYAQKKVNETT